MRSFTSWIRVGIHWVWGLSNPSLGFWITVFTTIPSLVIWFSLVALIWVGYHPLHLLTSLIHFPPFFFMLIIAYLFISYIDTCLCFISLSISITYRIEDLTTSIFSYISSLTLPLFAIKLVSSWDYLAHHILHTRVLDLIIGYLSLVSLHFFHPITLRLHYGPCHKTTLRPWD